MALLLWQSQESVLHKATVAPRHRPSSSSKVAVATGFVEEGVVVGGQGDQATTNTSTTNGALWVQGEASEQVALKPFISHRRLLTLISLQRLFHVLVRLRQLLLLLLPNCAPFSTPTLRVVGTSDVPSLKITRLVLVFILTEIIL